MPVANIIDSRARKYDVRCDVVFEPSCHDNMVKGATKFPPPRPGERVLDLVVEFCDTTIEAALKHAAKWKTQVTMFIYPPGSSPASTARRSRLQLTSTKEKEAA